MKEPENYEEIFTKEYKGFEFRLLDEGFDPTKHSIATGDDGVLDDIFSFAIYNYIKNHWRAATAPADIQPGMIWSDSDDDKLYHHGAADEEILQLIRSNDVSPQFATIRLMDTGADHYLDIKCNEDLGAHRLLNIVVGDAARTITLAGNPTLHTFTSADWLDQAVKVASSPQFQDIIAYKNGADVEVFIHEDAGTHDARLHLARGATDWYIGIMGSSHLEFKHETDTWMRLGTSGNLILYSATSKITGGTLLNLEAGSHIASETIYTDTTTNAACMNIHSDPWWIRRVTSAAKYKDKIEDLELDSSLLYNIRPVSFNSLCEGDDKEKRFHGLVADDVERIYPEIMQYNEKNEVESYDDRMLMTLILAEVQKHEISIEALKAQLNN